MSRAEVSLSGRDILNLASLAVPEYELILDTAQEMKKVLYRDIKKLPTLRGKSIVTLFYEASTRTRTSFELAGKYLGADVVNIAAATSSASKGESLRDTLYTLNAMHFDAVVMRHPVEGAADFAAKAVGAVVLNAGDGNHAHPTQGLLDMLTIREHKKKFDGLKVAILGDILHSRVARSNIAALTKAGALVHVAGPRPLLPVALDELGVAVHDRVEDALRDADVVNVLRIQLERQKVGLFPTTREYARIFGLSKDRFALAKPDALIMHPGPVNRGLEISPEMAYGEQSVITQQVENGVAVRMALLYLTLTGGKKLETVD
jgi:aspartate carbamoyltransferase catalytic subunit